MQMPVMAKGVFIARFIAFRPAAVKAAPMSRGNGKILLNLSAKRQCRSTAMPRSGHGSVEMPGDSGFISNRRRDEAPCQEKTMQPTAAKSAVEAAREHAQRAQYAKLTAHYGKIGSAALNAALLHAKRKKAPALGTKSA